MRYVCDFLLHSSFAVFLVMQNATDDVIVNLKIDLQFKIDFSNLKEAKKINLNLVRKKHQTCFGFSYTCKFKFTIQWIIVCVRMNMLRFHTLFLLR